MGEFILHDVLAKPDRLFLTFIIVFVCGLAALKSSKKETNRKRQEPPLSKIKPVANRKNSNPLTLRPEFITTAGAIASVVQTSAKAVPKLKDPNEAQKYVLI